MLPGKCCSVGIRVVEASKFDSKLSGKVSASTAYLNVARPGQRVETGSKNLDPARNSVKPLLSSRPHHDVEEISNITYLLDVAKMSLAVFRLIRGTRSLGSQQSEIFESVGRKRPQLQVLGPESTFEIFI